VVVGDQAERDGAARVHAGDQLAARGVEHQRQRRHRVRVRSDQRGEPPAARRQRDVLARLGVEVEPRAPAQRARELEPARPPPPPAEVEHGDRPASRRRDRRDPLAGLGRELLRDRAVGAEEQHARVGAPREHAEARHREPRERRLDGQHRAVLRHAVRIHALQHHAARGVAHRDQEAARLAPDRELDRPRQVDHAWLDAAVERRPQPDPAELVARDRGAAVRRRGEHLDRTAVDGFDAAPWPGRRAPVPAHRGGAPALGRGGTRRSAGGARSRGERCDHGERDHIERWSPAACAPGDPHYLSAFGHFDPNEEFHTAGGFSENCIEGEDPRVIQQCRGHPGTWLLRGRQYRWHSVP
jgi:hypothetical protein